MTSETADGAAPDRGLRVGDVPMQDLAERFGTPLYVYDGPQIDARYRELHAAFAGVDRLVAYSVKANGNLALLRRLRDLGSGADIVSLGELHRARLAGIPADRIVFAGVGKSRAEMEAGLREGIYGFNVESAGELDVLDGVAAACGVRAPVAVRVNPDILSPTPHEYTRTGHAASKFGVPVAETLDLYRRAAGRPGLEVRGIDVHIGSQILEPEPYLRALDEVMGLVARLREGGIGLEYIDLGGGFGVGYRGEDALPLSELSREVVPRVREAGLRLVLEPGRYVVGQAGTLLTRVLYVKRSGSKVFVVTDGGMTELLRPSHYGGYHAVDPVIGADGPVERVDVVGPICESGDFLARDRPMVVPEPGSLLAVRTAGAYGFVMASNYNARRRPAEVLVEGRTCRLVRRRETLDDLVRAELELTEPEGPGGTGPCGPPAPGP